MIARYALVVGKLQWSRARESAEIAGLPPYSLLYDAASMEPRS